MFMPHSRFWILICAAVVAGTIGMAQAADPTVFDSVPAPVTAPIREGVPLAGGPMRVLTVAERVGVVRSIPA